MEYTVFILMNSRDKYEVKGLLVLANMSTKSKAAVSCRNDAQRYRLASFKTRLASFKIVSRRLKLRTYK